MKNLTAFAIFLAATLISAGTSPAQQPAEKATVPFSFNVGNRTLPAGTYTIRTKTSSWILDFSNPEKNVHAMTMGQPDQDNPKHVNELQFYKYGNQYFLKEILSEDSSMNIHFATSKAEKSARAQTQEARNTVNDPVLIALK